MAVAVPGAAAVVAIRSDGLRRERAARSATFSVLGRDDYDGASGVVSALRADRTEQEGSEAAAAARPNDE